MSEWDGATYRQVSRLQDWLAERALAGIEFPAARRVLDIGCGDGRVTARIAARLPDSTVVGIDRSAGMLAAAQTAQRPQGTAGSSATRCPARGPEAITPANSCPSTSGRSSAASPIARM